MELLYKTIAVMVYIPKLLICGKVLHNNSIKYFLSSVELLYKTIAVMVYYYKYSVCKH